MREARIIERIESLWGAVPDSAGVVRGDDCAVLELPGLAHDLLITTDQIVEGTHFVWGRHSARDLGRKALVRSLSDVAAMGGWPLFLAQTVCLPAKALAGDWHDKFQQGLRQAATEAGVPGLALLIPKRQNISCLTQQAQVSLEESAEHSIFNNESPFPDDSGKGRGWGRKSPSS